MYDVKTGSDHIAVVVKIELCACACKRKYIPAALVEGARCRRREPEGSSNESELPEGVGAPRLLRMDRGVCGVDDRVPRGVMPEAGAAARPRGVIFVPPRGVMLVPPRGVSGGSALRKHQSVSHANALNIIIIIVSSSTTGTYSLSLRFREKRGVARPLLRGVCGAREGGERGEVRGDESAASQTKSVTIINCNCRYIDNIIWPEVRVDERKKTNHTS